MIEIRGLRHRYGDREVLSLEAFDAAPGEHWLVTGPSGCGKTTLLHILAGLIRPSAGSVRVAGEDIAMLPGPRIDALRGRAIGVVPQRMHLLPSLDLAGNLRLAQFLAGVPLDAARVGETLGRLGLGPFAHLRPHQLSVGQVQRAAVARAVVNRPALLLADEPTSNLDDAHCEQVLELLEAEAAVCGATLVIVTHDSRARRRIGRELALPARELREGVA